MILRKPYAFLIKNFKKIHLLLLILTLLVGYNSNKLLAFFNEFVTNRSVFYSGRLSSEYINPYMFIFCLLSFLLALIVFILMRQKNKPRNIYIYLIILYLLLPILFFVDYNILNTIQFEGLDPGLARLIRDINFISLLVQIPGVISIFIRTIGFDIKKFNFLEDIIELEIDVDDNEEFELTSGIDINKIGRKYRSQRRELKYFYQEYKNILFGILGGFLILILSIFIYNTKVVNKLYNEGDNVLINGLNIKINDLYSTKLNYKGEEIADKGYTYFILSMSFNNTKETDKKIDINNLRLIMGENIYSPDIRKYDYFIDLGVGYDNQIIKPNGDIDYIFVYRVNDKEITGDKIIRYVDELKFNGERDKTKYIKFKVIDELLDEKVLFNTADLGVKVYFGLSSLKDSYLNINSIEYNDTFEYISNNIKTYIYDSNTSNTIMKVNYDLIIDSNITYIKNIKELISKFGKLTYVANGRKYNLQYKDLTPSGYKGNDIYLSVDKKIKDYSNLELIITIRNKVYTFKLK